MKVLITSDLYKPSVNGVVTSILNLKEGLEKRGHEVKILTLGDTLRSKETEEGYELGSISGGKIYQGVRIGGIHLFGEVSKAIEWGPDVVHTNCEFSTFISALRIAHELQIPLVHTYHTVYEDYTQYVLPGKMTGKTLVKEFTKIIARGTDGIIVPTPKIEQMLKDYGVKMQLFVVPTGVNLHKFSSIRNQEFIRLKRQELGIPEENRIMISVGRVAPEKSLDKLIDTRHLMGDVPVTLLIVGGGPAEEDLHRQAEELHLLESKKVVFTGMIDPEEVHSYYQLGDVFACASTSETQGLTYYEAMACGLPLICLRDECLDMLVEEGENGYQCKSIEQLKDCLLDSLGQPEKLQQMGQKSAMKVQEFDNDLFCQRVEQIYLELIRQNEKDGNTKMSIHSVLEKIHDKL